MKFLTSSRRKFIQHVSCIVAGKYLLSKPLFSETKLPKVLIIGDSISIGYMPFVKHNLRGQAAVYRPMESPTKAENCQGTTNGVGKIKDWIKGNQWDVIHFNFGLHDIKHVHPTTGKNSKNPTHPHQASPKQYKKNLKKIVKVLKGTNAKLIFATTTPYPADVKGPLRKPRQPEIYNKVAKKIMQKNKIPVNDLFMFVLPQMAALERPRNVHFTEKGSRALGKVVSDSILMALNN